MTLHVSGQFKWFTVDERGELKVRMMKLAMLTIIAVLVSACSDDKTAGTPPATEAAAVAESTMAGAPAAMAGNDEYGRIVNHSTDEVEFELRRSIGGIDRMIEQFTTDGYATDELEAQKAELSAKLDAVLAGA